MNRRSFLTTIGITMAVLFVQPQRLFSQIARHRYFDLSALRLANYFKNKKSAAFIGSDYLKQSFKKTKTNTLVKQICTGMGQDPGNLSEMNNKELYALLKIQILKDFEFNQTINLNGWVLSQTEVQLCTLSYLI